MSDSQAARTFGVCRQSVGKWVGLAEAGGVRALAARKRGPKPVPRMSAEAERGMIRAIRAGCPDRLGLPFALWTREAVVALIRRRTGRAVSVWTAGRYLRRWGMTPQRPARRAYERDPAAVRAWLELFFLPGYSPDLNPDECLNQDTKQAMKNARPADQREMMGNVRSHLHRRQREPEIVKRFFQERHVRYAAA